MKTMKNFLSMAALALMGAMMTGCSSDDNFDNPQQPEKNSNVVTLTTTVGFDASAGTRALTETGVKTFGTGDQMAVIYKNTSGGTVKAVGTLTSGAGTKSGTFTFTLTNPDKTQNVTYIYPAAMAGSTGVDYTKLNSQTGGTLTDLGSKYDLATNSGAWNAGALPSLTLNNQLAILAVTLKNSGSSDITSTITGMTLGDGTNTYSVTREAAAGPIYVAIQPTTSASISITATDGSKNYAKSLTGKDYAANNGYSVSWTVKQQYSITLTGPYNGTKLVMEFCEGDTWNDMAAKYPTYLSIHSTTKWVQLNSEGFICDSNNKKVLATAQIVPNATYTVQ
jgi:hypothetical protein